MLPPVGGIPLCVYVGGMKQSVYLSDTEHARWKALGVTLGDVIRAGLATLEAAKERLT